jgi:hypothetical protein
MRNEKKYLFLDLDSVMITERKFDSEIQSTYIADPFDPKCVEVLNEIIEIMNPLIILTSDRRLKLKIAEMNEVFKYNGVKSPVKDYTPDFWGTIFTKLQDADMCRGFEILRYVHQYQIENYVAVDDMSLTGWVSDHFVWCTNSTEGLNQTGVKEQILKILM